MIRQTVVFIILLSIVNTFPAIAQKIWRVDNNLGTKSSADFETPQAAVDSDEVMPGDFIYIRGSGINYGDLTINKELHFFGPGYFLGVNPETQANFVDAKLGTVVFNPDSDESTFTGMHLVEGVEYLSAKMVVWLKLTLEEI